MQRHPKMTRLSEITRGFRRLLTVSFPVLVLVMTACSGDEDNPVWSLDGSECGERGGRIAFASDRTGNFDIYTMNVDGTELVNLTGHGGRDAIPAVSPDGMRIAFETTRDGNSEIYVMGVDGTNLTNLTVDAGEDWEPD